jgi:hypothetical protein
MIHAAFPAMSLNTDVTLPLLQEDFNALPAFIESVKSTAIALMGTVHAILWDDRSKTQSYVQITTTGNFLIFVLFHLLTMSGVLK